MDLCRVEVCASHTRAETRYDGKGTSCMGSAARRELPWLRVRHRARQGAADGDSVGDMTMQNGGKQRDLAGPFAWARWSGGVAAACPGTVGGQKAGDGTGTRHGGGQGPGKEFGR